MKRTITTTRTALCACLMFSATSMAAVRYVATEERNGSNDNDGLTAETPKLTVQAALDDLAETSQTEQCYVYVADGTYAHSADGNFVAITNSISVVGNLADPSLVAFTYTGVNKNKSHRLAYLNHANALLAGVTLANGVVYQADGGNVHIAANGGTVSNCVITAGFATSHGAQGGNVYMDSANALVTHSVISKGYVDSSGPYNREKGGGVQLQNGRLENCLVKDNYETSDGSYEQMAGGAFVTKGAVINCTFANNTGKTCGGIYVNGSSVVITNCVIAGNTASLNDDYSAYRLKSGVGAGVFVNCALDSATVPNDTCKIATAGEMFTNFTNGDCRPGVGSVAIDLGATLENPPAIDLAGKVRVKGSAIDAGCYEFDPNAPAIAFSVSQTSGIVPIDIVFSAVVTGFGDNVTYNWDFDNDGIIDQTTSSPDVTCASYAGGIYSVKLTVSDGLTNLSLTKENLLQLAPETLYVDAASSNPVFPYGSWETAAMTPADAIRAAVDDCEIIVRKGTYKLSSLITVEKDVYLHSETQVPESVLLNGQRKCQILKLNSPKAFVSGLTVENGYINQGGYAGVLIDLGGGTISNCVIRNCMNENYYGNFPALKVSSGGIATHCVISNCTTTTSNDGTKYIISVGEDAHLENSLISGNYSSGTGLRNDKNAHNCSALLVASAKSFVRNNTFVNNTIANRGLINVASDAIFVNNVFANNEFIGSKEFATDKDHAGKTTIGFNFGTSASVEGLPVYTNCAFDATCEFDELPNDTCKIGTVEEMFANFANGDFRPKVGGPLFNAGAAVPAWADALDLAGKPRVQGSKIDIGAYEAPAGGFRILVR